MNAVRSWFRSGLPLLVSAAYLVVFARALLLGTAWSTSDFEGDTIRVLLASLPFSAGAFLFRLDRHQVFLFWGACALLNGVLIYLLMTAYIRKTVICARGLGAALVSCGAAALVLWAGCLITVADARVAFFRALDPGACILETLQPVTILGGVKFEFNSEDCDTIAKTEYIDLYASTAPVNGDSALSRWANRRTRIFAYVPGRLNSHGWYGTPGITLSGENRFLISVPEVSSISFRRQSWRNRPIDYAIGRIISENTELHAKPAASGRPDN
jgi:hypothetical protein